MPDFDFQIALDRLAESLLPDEDIRQQKANAVVISHDGGVHSRPLIQSLPWYRADVSIPGAVSAGSAVLRIPFPQGATVRHVSVSTGTAPLSTFNFRLVAGPESQSFGMQGGVSTMMRGVSIDVDAGSWLVIDVTSSGGAADVEITIHYTPNTGGA